MLYLPVYLCKQQAKGFIYYKFEVYNNGCIVNIFQTKAAQNVKLLDDFIKYLFTHLKMIISFSELLRQIMFGDEGRGQGQL